MEVQLCVTWGTLKKKASMLSEFSCSLFYIASKVPARKEIKCGISWEAPNGRHVPEKEHMRESDVCAQAVNETAGRAGRRPGSSAWYVIHKLIPYFALHPMMLAVSARTLPGSWCGTAGG
jgi:hypothetical protein